MNAEIPAQSSRLPLAIWLALIIGVALAASLLIVAAIAAMGAHATGRPFWEILVRSLALEFPIVVAPLAVMPGIMYRRLRPSHAAPVQSRNDRAKFPAERRYPPPLRRVP